MLATDGIGGVWERGYGLLKDDDEFLYFIIKVKNVLH